MGIDPVTAGIGGSLISGVMGSRASSKAADASSDAANRAAELQREIYGDTSKKFAPFLGAGNLALEAYMYEMGLGEAPTIGGSAPRIQTITTPGQTGTTSGGGIVSDFGPGALENALNQRNIGQTSIPGTTTYRVGGKTFGDRASAQRYANNNKTGGTEYQGFTGTPGYAFRVDQGNDSVNALAGARGGLNSGRTMQDLMEFGQGIASSEYGTYMDRLTGLTNMGTSAAANSASAGQNYAANAGNAYMAGGQAQANGYINGANAISGGMENALGTWQYQQWLGKQ